MIKSDRTWDWVLAISVVLVFLVAVLLRVSNGVVTAGGIELPGVCWFQGLWGIGCPTCGLTRSFVSLAHGDVVEAFGWHPMGPVLALWLMAVLVLVIGGRVRGKSPMSGRAWFNRTFIAVTAICLVAGLIRGFVAPI